jgi:ubiquinone/menaquinone biosynthesis C-methylase UbiE
MKELNFGYAWYFTYGQLVVAALAAAPLFFGLRRGWSKFLLAPLALICLWGVAASFTARFLVDFNGLFELPTQKWFASGEGKVLDLGAGTGRSSIVVLREKPKAHLVALDEFGHSFEEHFSGTPSERILANLKAAGLSDRAMIQPGDMRTLPFPDCSFDSAISAWAIDHLRTDDVRKSLREARRVLKPGGDLLIMAMYKDGYMRTIFGPFMMHSSFRGVARWEELLREAGFEPIENGKMPMSLYFLARSGTA